MSERRESTGIQNIQPYTTKLKKYCLKKNLIQLRSKQFKIVINKKVQLYLYNCTDSTVSEELLKPRNLICEYIKIESAFKFQNILFKNNRYIKKIFKIK